MGAGGYESWFISARDPDSPRALWIAYEFGIRQPMPGIVPQPLPQG